MKVNVRHHENVSVLDLTGRMAIPEEVDVREAVTSLIKKGRTQILLNLKGVPWMDSLGLGELIACLKRVRERGGAAACWAVITRASAALAVAWVRRSAVSKPVASPATVAAVIVTVVSAPGSVPAPVPKEKLLDAPPSPSRSFTSSKSVRYAAEQNQSRQP